MGGFFSYRTVLFGVGSGLLVWCRVAAWVMRSTQAWLTDQQVCPNQLFCGRPHHFATRDLCSKAEVGHGFLIVVGIIRAETRLRERVVRARGSLDWHPFGDQ